jgi:hypothetical protein
MNATTSALIATLVASLISTSSTSNVSPQVPRTRRCSRSTAVIAIVFAVSTGCVAPCHDGFSSGFAHVLGLDCGCEGGSSCGCGGCVNCGCSDCPPDCCTDTDSSGTYCEDSAGLAGCAPCGPSPPCNPLHRICELPGETIGCVSSCCTPNACPGPPDCPPPGRFFPVPTRPAFSPRFVPGPYGPAEF